MGQAVRRWQPPVRVLLAEAVIHLMCGLIVLLLWLFALAAWYPSSSAVDPLIHPNAGCPDRMACLSL